MTPRRAFTLIELLVVVAILAILISIVLPAFSGARDHARRVRCKSNLREIGHGVHFYLQENRDLFPDAPFYGCLGYVGRSPYHMVLGSQIPESDRPLNRYFGVENSPMAGVSLNEQKRNHLFECPCDQGDAYFKLPGKYFVEHGTSYVYASDCQDPYVPTFGILSCRNLPLTMVRYPAKKIVFQEPVFNPSFDMNDPRAHWHDARRHHGFLLMADGHVQFQFTMIYEWDAVPDENEPYY